MKLAIAALLFFAPATALAFECTATNSGTTIAWVGRCIPYTIEKDDPAFDEPSERAQVDAAFALWSAPGCTDVRFISKGYATGASEGIHVESDSSGIPNGVALANIVFVQQTGEILEARITIDSSAKVGQVDANCVETYDLTNVVAHEIGHVLGFADDPAGESILTTNHDVCVEPWTSIGSNDVTGVCTVYPTNSAVKTCVPPVDGYDKNDQRLECTDVLGASGAPCTSDIDCGPGLACEGDDSTCTLDLSSRGCACSAHGPRRGPAGWLVALMTLMLGFRWRKASSR